MTLPLEIRITEHDMVITASSLVPYSIAMLCECEFGFILETEEDLFEILTPYDFACHDASCRPPNSGGTGGSKSGGNASGGGHITSHLKSDVSGGHGGGPGTIGGGTHRIGAAQHDADVERLLAIGKGKKDFVNNVRNSDGTLGVPFTKPHAGGTVEFTPAMEKWVGNKLKALGVTHEQLVDSLVSDALGAIKAPGAKEALKWYRTEHAWGNKLAKTYAVEPERVFAAVALTSAMRKWGTEGTGTSTSSTNKGAIETILRKLKDDEPVTITKEMANKFNKFKGTKKGIGLGVGTRIEPGMYKPSELSSATIARLATGLGWKILNTAGVAPVAKAIAVLRGEISVNDAVRGTKQRSFVSNLTHPDINFTSTNDLWHFRAIAGDLKFNFPDRRKHPDGTPINKNGKIRTTLKAFEAHTTGYNKKTGKAVHANAPHAIFTGGPPNGGLYSEVTKVTHDALKRLQASDPRFKGVMIHEFQALVWKYAGGNLTAAKNTKGSLDDNE